MTPNLVIGEIVVWIAISVIPVPWPVLAAYELVVLNPRPKLA